MIYQLLFLIIPSID